MKGTQLLQVRDGRVVRHDLLPDSSVMMAQMGLTRPRSAQPLRERAAVVSAARDAYDEAVRRYDEGDVEGFAALRVEKAVLVAPSGTAYRREDIGGYRTRIRAASPDHTPEVDLVVEQGDFVAAD